MINQARLDQLQKYIDESPYCPTPSRIPPIPKPQIPKTTVSGLFAVQRYIEQLGYNHLGDPFFVIKKQYSVLKLWKLSQDMITCGLPIKCLEACVLGMFLTLGMDVDRIPMAFKSTCNGNVYRHIVLVIKHGNKYGALGLSRRNDLMNKPIVFKTLSELVWEYKVSYERNNHFLEKVKIGMPAPHSVITNELIQWKNCVVFLNKPWSEMAREIDVHSRNFKK